MKYTELRIKLALEWFIIISEASLSTFENTLEAPQISHTQKERIKNTPLFINSVVSKSSLLPVTFASFFFFFFFFFLFIFFF